MTNVIGYICHHNYTFSMPYNKLIPFYLSAGVPEDKLRLFIINLLCGPTMSDVSIGIHDQFVKSNLFRISIKEMNPEFPVCIIYYVYILPIGCSKVLICILCFMLLAAKKYRLN